MGTGKDVGEGRGVVDAQRAHAFELKTTLALHGDEKWGEWGE